MEYLCQPDLLGRIAIGVILAVSGTSDVVDGHVALLGRRTGGTVYTSDPSDIEKTDPIIKVVHV